MHNMFSLQQYLKKPRLERILVLISSGWNAVCMSSVTQSCLTL